MAAFLYRETTEKITGSSMKVHSTMGKGFQEVTDQRALEIELRSMGLKFAGESYMPVYYKGIAFGERRLDFLVEGKINVDLKALVKLEPLRFAQARNYSEARNLKVGLLINFGAISLESQRLQNPKHKPRIIPDNLFIHPNPGPDK